MAAVEIKDLVLATLAAKEDGLLIPTMSVDEAGSSMDLAKDDVLDE
jgi:hypothetical protein